mmetsp:Transcript_13178/g.24301  ORF Transcript_13178/g.24301 Transcript_13178/m.24301 type:complete len:102 (-) Transcript_13178:859-1164(-)
MGGFLIVLEMVVARELLEILSVIVTLVFMVTASSGHVQRDRRGFMNLLSTDTHMILMWNARMLVCVIAALVNANVMMAMKVGHAKGRNVKMNAMAMDDVFQ